MATELGQINVRIGVDDGGLSDQDVVPANVVRFWGGERLGMMVQFTFAGGNYAQMSLRGLRQLVNAASDHPSKTDSFNGDFFPHED